MSTHQVPDRRDVRLAGPVWAPQPVKAPAFAEWADPNRDAAAQLMRHAQPCALCSHPTNDCTVHRAGPTVVDITPIPNARTRPQEDTRHG